MSTRRVIYDPTTAKLYARRFVAETVAPKLENVIVPPPAGTAALALPSEALAVPRSVTVSVSPAQDAGTEGMLTCVTFPALFTLRVALREATPQEATEAFPAERAFDPSAKEAAAPQAANVTATARAVPRIFARSFISVNSSKAGR
jgi:hypothetical protein